MQSYRRAIELDPSSPSPITDWDCSNTKIMTTPAQPRVFALPLAYAPNLSEAHANLANALFQMGSLEEAVDSYRRALALNPNDATSHSNLGLILQDLGLLDEAIEHCQRAIALQPDFPAAHNHLGLALLLKGDFENGLPHHEWRWQVRNLRMGGRRFDQPAWRGEPLNGGRILLHAEQGAGDTLQFLRYAPLVAARGGRVLIEMPPELKRLAHEPERCRASDQPRVRRCRRSTSIARF